MADFNYSINEESAVRVYDNQGAYNTLLQMMKRNEQLTVKLYSGKDNVPCAWIESRSVAGFKYQLKSLSFQGLLNYLFNGEVADFDSNPMEVDSVGENDDFQYKVMQMMIETGKTIQFVPLFRERFENISGYLPCFKGKIIFRIKRTDEVLNYLRENKQAI